VNIIHKRRRIVLSLLLACLMLMGQFNTYLFCSPSFASTVLLNDRAADIIASSPLTAWDLSIPGGLDGEGQIVGIADSGLDKGSVSDIHPDLKSEAGKMPRVVMLKSYTDREIPDDPDGHGTHMAATIVGNGSASNGQYQGIAPGASLYFQAMLDSNGKLQIPGNLNNLFTPAYAAGVRIHVDGWGTANNSYGNKAAQIDNFVYTHPDFLPIFGAGNSGPGAGSLTTEANSKNALVVGASQVPRAAFSPEARYADQIADSSSRGPTADGRIKPELLAPGSAIISACSSLSESNFKANEQYTRMGGSSMAAAVSGGTVALIREYLNKELEIKNPSSALIKALLINGARPLEGGPSAEGFGIIDAAATILALEESSFKLLDSEAVKEGETLEYSIDIADIKGAFKASLSWIDPPAAAGTDAALINNLDLTVKDPDGNLIYGNDFKKQGKMDSKNNTEQVYIDNPQKGQYIITVKGQRIAEEYAEQKFALVYGQALQQSAIKEINNNMISLENGLDLNSKNVKIKGVIDGLKTSAPRDMAAGNVVYLGAEAVYLFGRNWQTGGVQLLPTGEGNLLVEMSSEVRQGGYYLDDRAISQSSDILVNDEPLAAFNNFPAGSQIKAAINPVLQNLWQLSAAYEEISGYISSINIEEQTLKLLKDERSYSLAPWMAVSYSNNLLDSSAEEAPFAYGESAFKKLMPGMKVSLLLSPGTQIIHYVKVERDLVSGRVNKIDRSKGELLLDTGGSYHLYPGTEIYKDFQEASLEDIVPGDRVSGLLLPDSRELLQLNAQSQVNYGRIVYFGEKQKTLYLVDKKNNFQIYKTSDEMETFRWRTSIETASLESGNWARLICDPENGQVLRIDIAEIEEASSKTFLKFDKNSNLIKMTDGSTYRYYPSTLISKDGYVLSPQDLIPGEELGVTVLSTFGRYNGFLAEMKAEPSGNELKPELRVSAYELNGVLIIQGYTSADRLSIYREDGQRQVIIPEQDGHFSRLYKTVENEEKLRVIAIDSSSRAINVTEPEIISYPLPREKETFTDIEGIPAQEAIENLAARGIVHGYEDGRFRPDEEMSRLEMIMMIVSCKNLQPEVSGNQTYFTDSSDIPYWALSSVNAARENGIISGYPDGTFRPWQAVSRTEMAVILDRAFGDEANTDLPLLPYFDSEYIPLWGLSSVSRGYQRGLFEIMIREQFQPNSPLTRAQAAVILNRIIIDL